MPRSPSGPHRQAFPPSRRMHHAAEFRAAYRRGRRRGGPFWTWIAAPQADPAGVSRLGMTTPRRLGTAPLRNRIRRRLRTLARRHWADLPGGWDLVVQPRLAVARAPFPRLEAEWMACLGWLAHGKPPALGQNKT